MKKLLLIVSVISLSGCAVGRVNYDQPSTIQPLSNYKEINRPKDAVWNASVANLGKQFYIINNLDKQSGLINISYTGDPERYVDCGTITSYVKNLSGERVYKFPSSRARQSYELLDKRTLFSVDRRTNLEGRINLIFEDLGGNKTRVTANTHYTVTKQADVKNRHGEAGTFTATASFNSGGAGKFTGNEDQLCVPSGQLEQDILTAIQ